MALSLYMYCINHQVTFLEFYEALLLCAQRWGRCRDDRAGGNGGSVAAEVERCGGGGNAGEGEREGEGEGGGSDEGSIAVGMQQVFRDFFEGELLPRARDLLRY